MADTSPFSVQQASVAPSIYLRATTCAMATYAAIGGFLSLCGWIADNRRLTDWINAGVEIQPNAAVCACLAGAGVLFSCAGWFRAARYAGLSVATLGGLTFLEHMTGLSFGIDTLFRFERSWGDSFIVAPGRMGPAGSLCWLLLGTSISLPTGPFISRHLATVLRLVATAISALFLTGYLFGAQGLYTVPDLNAIAWQTATFIFAIGLALIVHHLQSEPMHTLILPGAGGMTARRALPISILLPIAGGVLAVVLVRHGVLDSEGAAAFRTLAEIVVLIAMLWWVAGGLERSEQAMLNAEKRARSKLRELEAIYSNAPVGLAVFAMDLSIRRINDRMAEFSGVPGTAHIGMQLEEMIPVLADHASEMRRRILATGENQTVEIRGATLAQPAVQRIWISSWYPLHDDADLVSGICVIMDDVTQRRAVQEALRETEERIRLAIAADEGAIWDVNLLTGDGACLYGKTFLLGGEGSNGNCAEHNWHSSIDADDRELVETEWDNAKREQRLFRCTYRLRERSGKRAVWVRVAGRFFYDPAGQPTRFAGVFVDVSDQKRAEQSLQDADQRKDMFLATLAHELRNPLAPITSSLEIIARAGKDERTVTAAYDTIGRQVSQLVRLVDDLLDLGRITRDTLELRRETVELQSVIHHVVDIGRTLCNDRSQRLDLHVPETPVFLNGDPVRLAQIFSNLINNAVKFTPAGGHISLSVEVAADKVIVRVSDTGIGIPEDMLETVFDIFTQVSTLPGQPSEGLGIGLHLVKRLVSLHGGAVSVSSGGVDGGSTFVIELPVINDAPINPPRLSGTPNRSVSTSGRHRVLVVDDNVDAAESMAALLRIAGHDVQTVHDGETALAALSDFDADLILLDIGLPKLSGLDVCRAIRQRTGRSDQLIVAVTGWGQESDRLKSREAGFDHHLTKPVDYDELTALLENSTTSA